MHQGRCQCGAIEYALEGNPLTCYTCHCNGCQTSTGTAFTLSMIVNDSDINIIKGRPSKVEYLQNGNEVQRHYCESCATTIWLSSDNVPGFAAIKPGTFDDNSWYRPIAHLWLSSAQPWLILNDDIPKYKEQPEMNELINLWAQQNA